MKKNIIIGILIVFNLVSIIYAVQKSSESKRLKETTEKLILESEEIKRNQEKSLQITSEFMQKAQNKLKEQKDLNEKLSEDK